MAFELMMDDAVRFVSVTGGADSGKTILATAVALEKVVEQCAPNVGRILLSENKSQGFQPLHIEERRSSWPFIYLTTM
ncbi:MAG TPA: hypothetical protein VHP54_05120 [Caproiciproducens sp.]|nr:hypothetical protein [Caproiciproducens sp.]